MSARDADQLAELLAKTRPHRDRAVSYQQWLKDMKAIAVLCSQSYIGFSLQDFTDKCLE